MQFQDEEISLRDSYLLSSETDALANLAPLVKNLPARQETLVRSLGQEDPLEKGQATHYSILGFLWWLRIRLQCGRPGFEPWVAKIPWRREWQPLQYSGPENSMDCIVHMVAKRWP